ncbi:hypothetical protein DPMN_029135 [Dreissena polymorpha]|uniref:Uncharacterized protein n=1 Tax=Dreissena polymorpha TaxID=45954 RepID=A0A9D4RFZ1_DREPO|nr:hypothetical protein DPMN_029135 [Dreissena polymorpha]
MAFTSPSSMLNLFITCHRHAARGRNIFKVNTDGEEVKLLLQVFLNDDFVVEDLFHSATPNSEYSLLIGQKFVSLTFQSMKEDA